MLVVLLFSTGYATESYVDGTVESADYTVNNGTLTLATSGDGISGGIHLLTNQQILHLLLLYLPQVLMKQVL